MVVDLLLLPLFCVVLCPSVYIQYPQCFRLLSGLTGDSAVVVYLLLLSLFVLFYTRQYIFKTLSGFGCCLFSQAMMLSVLTGDDAVVVDLLFIVAPIVLSRLFYARQYI